MPPIVPAVPRDSSPCGVRAIESARIASGIPGASRSSTDCVASGVTSRSARPVPPVVSTSSAPRGELDDRPRDLVLLVGHEPAQDGEPVGAQELLERGAASVLGFAARDPVGDREDGRPHARSPFVFSTRVISEITIPLSIAFAMS